MEIQSFTCGPFQTNAYIISCKISNKCAIVDPAPDSFHEIVECIEKNKLIPELILLTHSHFDHIGDLKKVKDYYKIPVCIHPADRDNVETPGSDGVPFFMSIPKTEIDTLLTDQQVMQLGELSFKVLHTPGHSPGGVCFYFAEKAVLISGDTLFKGSIGNLSLPTANIPDMSASLAILSKLPEKTKVYPGHGTSTTIGNESWLSSPEELFPDLNQ